jgi:hypothetical protein
MRGFISNFAITSAVLSSLIMIGCSSSDDGAASTVPTYTGVTTPAAITTANAEEMGRGATEGVNESTKIATIGDGIPFAVDINSSNSALALKIEGIARNIIESLDAQNLPVGLVVTADDLNQQTGTNYYCGGSVTVPDNFDPVNDYWNFVMTFNNLCFDDGTTALVMNGALAFAETDTEFSISFTNFSADLGGTVETFSATVTCPTSTLICTISTEFTGSDGNVYKLTDVDVSGDAINGFYISATFYHYSLGQAFMETSGPITYGSCGIHPDGGTITVYSPPSSMNVTYNPNCTFTISGNDGTSDFGPTDYNW